ncbi:MAG: sulfite exporter TauE/SafE family protein [Deltaproteobacteria bacterium]|nr:sulfite exporter TauE/SafE family protein [Deltaproteobacteria bacterium]
MSNLILAAVLALPVGISMGLLGGGGSILAVPIMIYALGMEERSAIAGSLVVVGLTSLVAAVQHALKKNVVWRVALSFSAAGMIGAYAGGHAAALVPARILLILFALLMFGTAVGMWRGRRERPAASTSASTTASSSHATASLAKTLSLGLLVGFVTGLLGAGGGFMIVPALALLGGLSMHKAVGTSLVVITLNAFAGLLAHAAHATVGGNLVWIVAGASIVGTFIGAALSRRVSQASLRKGFAVFVLIMGVFIVFKQLHGFA